MLPLPVILESQVDMSVVDGATTEPRIRINRPDDENTRCRVSSVRGQPKDFSQLTQPPTTRSTSSAISLLQERTEHGREGIAYISANPRSRLRVVIDVPEGFTVLEHGRSFRCVACKGQGQVRVK
jgi:hypothetical protein